METNVYKQKTPNWLHKYSPPFKTIVIKNTFGSLYSESVWIVLYIWTANSGLDWGQRHSCAAVTLYFVLGLMKDKSALSHTAEFPPACLYILLHSFYSSQARCWCGSADGAKSPLSFHLRLFLYPSQLYGCATWTHLLQSSFGLFVVSLAPVFSTHSGLEDDLL